MGTNKLRSAPADRIDAIYERQIEIQERQQSIAEQQVKSDEQRDRVLDKVMELVTHGPDRIVSKVKSDIAEAVRTVMQETLKATDDRLRTIVQPVVHVGWALAIAILLAGIVGSPVGHWFFTLIGFKP